MVDVYAYLAAVDRLGSADPVVRAAGLRALGTMALAPSDKVMPTESSRDDPLIVSTVHDFLTGHDFRALVDQHAALNVLLDCSPALVGRLDFSGVIVHDINLRGRKLRGIALAGISFIHGNFQKADLTDASLAAARFEVCDLSGTILDSAVLRDVVIEDSDLTNSRFRKATMTRAKLSNAQLAAANFEGATGLTADALTQCTTDEYTKLPFDFGD